MGDHVGRNILVIVSLIGIVMLGACDTQRQAANFTDSNPLPRDTQIAIGEMKTMVGIPQDFDYQDRMRRQLEKRLNEEHMLAAPQDPKTAVINLTVTEFQRGDLGLRMIPFQFGERTASSIFGVTAELVRDGKSLGTMTARKAINMGGVLSAGGEDDMVINCMDLIVDQIEEKMRGK